MSIDARICGVTGKHGVWKLILEPRGSDPAGQESLIVTNPPDPPEKLVSLIGQEIWGGCAEIMLGETKIAKRLGYVRIELLPKWDAASMPPERARRILDEWERRKNGI